MASPFVIAAPQAGDALAVLLIKAAYYAKAAGSSPTVSAPYSNMAPQAGDPLEVAAVKLAYWLSGITSGSGGGATTSSGAGAPVNGVAQATDIYMDTNTGFFYFNTGTHSNPTWVRH